MNLSAHPSLLKFCCICNSTTHWEFEMREGQPVYICRGDQRRNKNFVGCGDWYAAVPEPEVAHDRNSA